LLRSIAILSVIISHTFAIPFFAFGVQLFFVISGYLLIESLNLMSKKAFILYRIARLFPLAIGMTIIFYFRFDTKLEFVSNFLLISSFIPNYTSFPGGWSINHEWIFSFIILIIAKLKNSKFIKLLLLLMISNMIIYDFFISKSLRENEIVSFKVIVLQFFVNTTFLFLGIQFKKKHVKLKPVSLFFSILFLTLFILLESNSSSFYTPWLVIIFLLVDITLKLNFPSFVKKPIIIKLIHFFGYRTYGLFCSHFVVMILLNDSRLLELFLLTNSILAKFVYFITTLFLSSILAYFSYKYIEKPSILMVRKYIYEKKI
jgi:peptidoglycan/LPS O-acetylase OafA/YrhL